MRFPDPAGTVCSGAHNQTDWCQDHDQRTTAEDARRPAQPVSLTASFGSVGVEADLTGYTCNVTAKTIDEDPAGDTSTLSTRARLLNAGEGLFSERGFEETRLDDICRVAGVTTGAFYGYFATKAEFFAEMLGAYVQDLEGALDAARSLEESIEAYLLCARRHRGAVRASFELTLADGGHQELRRGLREKCAAALAWQMRGDIALSRARVASKMLIDALDQLTLSQAAGWTEPRDPAEMAATLATMARRGLFLR